MKDQILSVSLIVLLDHAEERISSLYENIVRHLEATEKSFELIFVDDGSRDKTYALLQEISQKDARVRVIRMRARFGEAAAFDAGLKNSRGEKVLFITERVRVNVSQLSNLLSALNESYDFVVGRRYPRRDSVLNRWVSRWFNGLVNRISKLDLQDINSGVFAAKRSVFESLPTYGDLFNFLPVLAAQQGYKLTEVDIEQMPGTFRTSRYFSEYIRRLLDIVTVFFLTRYSKKPIHFMGFLGMIFFFSGLIIELYLFVYRIFQFGPIAGRPLLILGALLLIIGIQMVSIGLLGEMIIFTHAGEIEEYNIEEIINNE